MFVRNLLRGLLVCILATAPLWAVAQPAQVSSRTALAGNDYFDWAGAGSPWSQPANGFSLVSVGFNVTLTASTVNDDNLRLLQDTAIGFPTGDGTILEVGFADDSGPLSIRFATPVLGVGAQINAAISGVQMVAQLKLFDLADVQVAAFNTGQTGSLSDPFLGATFSSGIGRIEFDIIEIGGTSRSSRFAINRLDVVAAPVPEPGAVVMLLAGLGVLRVAVRRQNR